MRILLAEDERTMAEPIVAFLEYHKYTVDWVDNGADAYRQASAQAYDGLILDIMMPKMSSTNVKIALYPNQSQENWPCPKSEYLMASITGVTGLSDIARCNLAFFTILKG